MFRPVLESGGNFARFSGVSTGACIGHIGPEGLAGGPIGKLLEGDRIRLELDRVNMTGTLDFVGDGEKRLTSEEGARVLAKRSTRPDLAPHVALPDDTRLWAALQLASGGTWGGCVYDADKIIEIIAAGREALASRRGVG